MNPVSAFLLGIIQGLTEFLPVSSSAHLALLGDRLGINQDSDAFLGMMVLLHFATLISIAVVYRKEIFALIPAFFTGVYHLASGKTGHSLQTKEEKTVFALFVGSLPMGLALLFKDRVEDLCRYPLIIGILLMVNGLMLCFVSFLPKGNKNELTMSSGDAVRVGLFQLLATVPGLSRSGTTIFGGRLAGLSPEWAVGFSFFLSMPTVLAANLVKLPTVVSGIGSRMDPVSCLVGVGTAFIIGILAVKLLSGMAKKTNYTIFSVYCIILGSVTVICNH